MTSTKYDLSTAQKNPYAEEMKKGYSIIINVPPESEYEKEMEDFYLSDDELYRIKELVAREEARREEARRKKQSLAG